MTDETRDRVGGAGMSEPIAHCRKCHGLSTDSVHLPADKCPGYRNERCQNPEAHHPFDGPRLKRPVPG